LHSEIDPTLHQGVQGRQGYSPSTATVFPLGATGDDQRGYGLSPTRESALTRHGSRAGRGDRLHPHQVHAQQEGRAVTNQIKVPDASHSITIDADTAHTLRPSTSHSYCPYKGDVSYYDVVLPDGPNFATPPGPTRLPTRRWTPSPAAWRSTPTASRLKLRRWRRTCGHTSGSDDRPRARHKPDRGPSKHRGVTDNAEAPFNGRSHGSPLGRLLAGGGGDCDRYRRVERPEPPVPRLPGGSPR
jgi:hypothetical protein